MKDAFHEENEATEQGVFSISSAKQKKMSVKKWQRNVVKRAIVLSLSRSFSAWHKSVKHKVKESTEANYYLKANKHILPVFGNKPAESIEDTEIYEFIESKQQAGLSNRYISDMLIVMKSMFKYAEFY